MKKYIVQGINGVMEIEEDWVPDGHRKGVLCFGDKATVFNSLKSAKRAIERTKKYEEENGFDWETWRLQPVRLEFE